MSSNVVNIYIADCDDIDNQYSEIIETRLQQYLIKRTGLLIHVRHYGIYITIIFTFFSQHTFMST